VAEPAAMMMLQFKVIFSRARRKPFSLSLTFLSRWWSYWHALLHSTFYCWRCSVRNERCLF